MDYMEWEHPWKELVNKYSDNGYEGLTPDERVWFNVRCLIDSVDNGGIISFYYNSGADYLEETIEDLNKLKASKAINLLKKVNKLFPNGKPSKNIAERNDVISSWEDEQNEKLFEKLDEQFYELEEDLESKLELIIKKVISAGLYPMMPRNHPTSDTKSLL